MRRPNIYTSIFLLAKAFAIPSFAQDGASTIPVQQNRLAHSQSPYLLQHATNPVNWYPWGEEAFQKAKEENKPVLLSIGYSTCHWCHVMNRESFSNPEIAQYLNEHFVCIKVDREERPDVDTVYMNFLQRLTGSGGWPLNVWLTPERKPFFGGTYFPPRRQAGYNSPSFKDVLTRIQKVWTEGRAGLLADSDRIVKELNRANDLDSSADIAIDNTLRIAAIDSFHTAFDESNGGFGGAPKFPSPANLSFLLKAATDKSIEKSHRDRALEMATNTLEKLASSGTRDQIGGGFHRYSVDPAWQLPHFEKMLYDQALLANAYLEAWLITRKQAFKNAATTTLDYLLRDMQNQQGGFYSAEDAESIDPLNPDTKREGAFYVWSWDEIQPLLEDDALVDFARNYYSLTQAGNSPNGPYHTKELDGFNTLRRADSLENLAQKHTITLEQAQENVATINHVLFQERNKRVRPHLDDKIIVSWNGLAISALARGALYLQEERYQTAAAKAAQFIQANLYDDATGELTRLYRDSPSTVKGFADDYAFLVTGLIDLYESTADPHWLQWAKKLQETQNALFYDVPNGGFFSAQESSEIVFARSKQSHDGVIPSVNSVSIANLNRLSQFFNDAQYREKARKTVSVFLPRVQENPRRMPVLLDSMSLLIGKPVQIVVAGSPNSSEVQSILATVSKSFLPNRVLMYADSGASQRFLSENLEFITHVGTIEGKATAYVCENYACQLPTNDITVLEEQLASLRPE